MSTTQVIELLLSSAVISGVVTAAITYFFETKQAKTLRNFELCKEAYMKAIASISGASHTVVDYFLKKLVIDNRLNPMVVTEFVAAHGREISSAILVATDEIRNYLKKIAPLIVEAGEIIEEASAAAVKSDGTYVIKEGGREANRLKDWGDRMETLENKIISAMQKDLGLRD